MTIMGATTAEGGEPEVPVGLRVHLAHAALQAIAEDAGVDILHVKGPAVDPSLGRPRSRSTDADVIVRPDKVNRFMRALAAHGWSHVTSFETGSAFEHAATLYHSSWGYTDVHRTFPGLTAPRFFDELWADHITAEIAGIPCAVPSLTAQRLILLLHVARNGASEQAPDFVRAWTESDAEERERIRGLAGRLGAEVGLAAALGHLDDYADDPSHDLWAVFSEGHASRLDEWRGRFKAARTPVAKLRILCRSLLVNTDHLAMRLGRRPTRREIAEAFLERIREAAHELRQGGNR